MKKILFLLLLFTAFLRAQTLPNPTYGNTTTNTLKVKTNTEASTSTKLSTQETDGSINFIQPINVPIPYTPSNYTISNQSIGQHLTGIDTRLGQISSTTAGITQRVYFTADNTTVTAGTFFTSSLTGKGSTATGSPPALVLADNTKGYFTKDIISVAFPAATIGYAGSYTGQLTVSATPTPVATQQRFTVEIYRTNNGGTPIASGVSGAPTGDLGVTVVAILDSGILNLTAGSITNIPVTGILTQNITLNTGERLRYHVSAAKIGSGGGNVTFGVYYGSSYNSYYDVPVAITTDAVLNKSGVTGVTSTDALNNLKESALESSKKWVLFGDSLSNTLVDPDYPFYTIQKLGLTGTVTNAVAGNTSGEQLTVLQGILSSNPNYFNNFDIVTILVGVNDWATNVQLGKRNSLSSENNYSGHIKKMIELILTAKPTIRLYVMTPFETDSVSFPYQSFNALNYTLKEMSVLLGQICSDYSVQCIDLYSFSQINKQTIPALFSDGVHPNSAGASLIGNLVAEAFLSKNNKGNQVDFSTPKKRGDIYETVNNSLYKVSDGNAVPSSIYDNSTINEKQIIVTDDGIETFKLKATGASAFYVASGNPLSLDTNDDYGTFLRFRKNTGTPRSWDLGATSSLSSAGDNSFALYDNLAGSFRFVMSPAGVFKINNLSGPGIRNLAADSDGNLVISNVDSRAYKVYTALLTQSGTSAPTATVLENTLEGTIVWTRDSAGTYTGTLSSAFTLDKTAQFIGNSNTAFVNLGVNGVNEVKITTYSSSGSISDSLMSAATYEVRVYN